MRFYTLRSSACETTPQQFINLDQHQSLIRIQRLVKLCFASAYPPRTFISTKVSSNIFTIAKLDKVQFI